MNREIKTFKKIDILNSNNNEKHFVNILSKVKDFMINLQKLNCTDENILKQHSRNNK